MNKKQAETGKPPSGITPLRPIGNQMISDGFQNKDLTEMSHGSNAVQDGLAEVRKVGGSIETNAFILKEISTAAIFFDLMRPDLRDDEENTMIDKEE